MYVCVCIHPSPVHGARDDDTIWSFAPRSMWQYHGYAVRARCMYAIPSSLSLCLSFCQSKDGRRWLRTGGTTYVSLHDLSLPCIWICRICKISTRRYPPPLPFFLRITSSLRYLSPLPAWQIFSPAFCRLFKGKVGKGAVWGSLESITR